MTLANLSTMKHSALHAFSFLFILFGLLFTSNAFAQSPQGINYQAVAHDADGSALENQTVDVQLGIISSSPTGNLEYEEIHSVTTNEYGLFSLQIGTATQTGGSAASFSAINWGTNSYYLNVQVNAGNGYENIGTMQFMSVPYALYAESAGSSGSITGGQGIDVTGGVVTNTGDTDATDDITTSTTAGGDLSGTYPDPQVAKLQGTPLSSTAPAANQVLVFDGTEWIPATPAGTDGDWVINAQDIYTNLGGNVGIGTATPATPLHIETSDAFPLYMVSDNPTTTSHVIESTTSGSVPATIYVNGNDTMAMGLDPSNNMFFVIHNMPSGLVFMQSDSFLIASDNPGGTKFYVDGLAGADTVLAVSGLSLFAGSGNLGYVLADDGTGNAVWTDPQALFGGSDKISDADADTYVLTELNPDDDILRMGTDGVERMTILNTGEIGIGTNTPTHTLEAVSTDTVVAQFKGSHNVATAISIEPQNPTAMAAIVFRTANGDSAFIGQNPNNNELFIDHSTVGGRMNLRADTISIKGSAGNGFTYIDGFTGMDTAHIGQQLSLQNGSGNTGYVLADDGAGNAVWTDPNLLVTPAAQDLNSVLSVGGDGGNQPIVNVSSVGVGTNSPGATVDVIGDVQASSGFVTTGTQGYTYSSPKTKQISVPGAAFRTVNSNYAMSGLGTLVYTYIGTGTAGSPGWYAAPINIPDGATITNVTAYVYDNDPTEDINVRVSRMGNSGSGNVGYNVGSTTNASTAVQPLTGTINVTVDYSTYYYNIYVQATQANSNLRLYNVVLQYTVNEE